MTSGRPSVDRSVGDQNAQLLLQELGNALLAMTGHGNKDSDKLTLTGEECQA